MLELDAKTSLSLKDPKRHQGEESISETEDAEMSDLQVDRSPSPHFNAHETPVLDHTAVSDVSDSRRRSASVTIEEAEDVDSPGRSQSSSEGEMSEEDVGPGFEFIEDYPGEAGTPGPGKKKTPFEKLKKAQQKENKEPWSPFANEEEWELAKWLMTAGVSQARVDDFLKLPIVSAIVQPTFATHAVLKRHKGVPSHLFTTNKRS
jgi:hypothetical protein